MDGVISPLPSTTPVATPGERATPGDATPFAALLGALQEQAVATDDAKASLSSSPATEPAKDRTIVGDPLLLQALLAPAQAGAAPTSARPLGHGNAAGPAGASGARAIAVGQRDVPASLVRPRQTSPAPKEQALSQPAAMDPTAAAGPEQPAASPLRGAGRGLDPEMPVATEPGAMAQPVSSPTDAPAHQRAEAAAPPAAAPLPPQAETGLPAQTPQPDMQPTRIAPPHPIRQVAQLAIALSAGGEDEDRLSVALDPVELGHVEISIERQGGTAQVRVMAERPETLALLQRDHRELDRLLGQSGIGEEGRSLSFGLSSDGGGAGGHDHGSHHRGGSPTASRQEPPPATRPLLGLIDLAV